MASREASWEMDSTTSFPQAPYDSTTNDTQTQSSSLHLVSLDECFLSSVVSAATPVVTLASKRVVGISGDVTVLLLLLLLILFYFLPVKLMLQAYTENTAAVYNIRLNT